MSWPLVAYLYLLGFFATGALVSAQATKARGRGLPSPGGLASILVLALLWPFLLLYLAASRIGGRS